MVKFEYNITKYPAGEFNNVVYFCSEQGECNFNQLPDDQLKALGDRLNTKGAEGWELVQLNFGDNGVVAFWKKVV